MADIEFPPVPKSYVERFAALVSRHGVDLGVLPEGPLAFAEFGRLVERAVELTGDPGLGLELGLELKPSSHGMVGFALMTCKSMREGLELGEKIGLLRCSPWRLQLRVEDETAIVRFVEVAPTTAGRQYLLEIGLGAVVGLAEYSIGQALSTSSLEFWTVQAEAPYHARFRDRLPRVHYNSTTIEARFPASWLDRPLALCEAGAHREVLEKLEQERRVLALDEDLLARTRALIFNPVNGFPDLEDAARRLQVTSRTLRRRLSQRGTTYQALRDEARRAHGTVLLERSKLPVEAVARELGYADSAGFVRAFQRWTGHTPMRYRRASQARTLPQASA